jgi:hypothetical protein
LTPIIFAKGEILSLVPKLIHDTLGFEEKLKKNKPPLYTYEEILGRVLRSHMGGMDERSCKILLGRGIRESAPGSGMFQFSHDIRVHYLPVMTLSTKQVSYIAQNIRYLHNIYH